MRILAALLIVGLYFFAAAYDAAVCWLDRALTAYGESLVKARHDSWPL